MRSRKASRRWISAFSAVVVGLAASAVVAMPAGAADGVAPADEGREQRDGIYISKNQEFNPANGVRSGSGTRKNPFVISGWDVDQVVIHDTGRPVVLRNNDIGVLVLNWNGRHIRLANNNIGQLHVNQNVERTGAPTTGKFVNNNIGRVTQLRHFDGVFAHNTVGSPDSMEMFGTGQAVNFDGFNGAHFHHNVIYGYVDATLHGHHHSSGFHKHSHNHYVMPEEHEHEHGKSRSAASAAKTDTEDEEEELPKSGMHGQRYHRVSITNNKIYSMSDYALRYTDQNHSGNDRTASSETDERLNGMHVHHTHIYIRGNRLYGSGIFIDVFNADDDHHKRIAPGVVQVKNNFINVEHGTMDWNSRWGILVQRAQKVNLQIVKNTVQSTVSTTDGLTNQRAEDTGILMNELTTSHARVMGNDVKDFTYGVRAANFTNSTRWCVLGLKTTRVQYPIFYDNTVANQPRRTR